MLLNPFRFGVSAPIVGYSANVLATNPVIYWRLDETSGTIAADSSGNGNDGIYYTDVSTLTTTGLLDSDSNAAIFLAGTSNIASGVTIAPNPISIVPAWSFEVIIEPTGVPVLSSAGCLLQMGGSPDAGSNIAQLAIIDNGSGTYKIALERSGVSRLGLTSNVWIYNAKRHIVLRTNGSNVELLIDGNVELNIAHTFSDPIVSEFSIGRCIFAGSTNYYPFKGVIDEVAFYNIRLSDGQIAAHIAAI